MSQETDFRDPVFQGMLRVPWSRVAALCAIVAAGSLGALVVVATVKQADVLSTVALALAILAFVVQIIMFVAQTAINATQDRESRIIHAETQSLLAEIRTRAVDTNAVVANQYDKLLDRVLLIAKESATEATDSPQGFDPDTFRALLLRDVAGLVADERGGQPIGSGSTLSSRRSSGPAATLRRANTWPSPSVIQRLKEDALIRGLDEAAVSLLATLANDVVFSAESGVPEGIIWPDGLDIESLRRAGLLHREAPDDEEDSGRPIVTLSVKGRALARLLTAHGPAPDDVKEALPWLQEVRQRLGTPS